MLSDVTRYLAAPPSSMRITRYYVLQTEGRKLNEKEAWKGSNTIDQVSPAVYVHYVASRVSGKHGSRV